MLGWWGTNDSDLDSSVHLLEWPLRWPVLYPTFVLLNQCPLYIMVHGDDLRVGFQLLWYKHLNIHLQALLKFAGPIFLIGYHVLRKPAKSQKFRNILVYGPIPLLQSDILLFHFLLG